MKQDFRQELVDCILNALYGKVCRIVQYGGSGEEQEPAEQNIDLAVFTPYRISEDEEERLSNAVYSYNKKHEGAVSVIDIPEDTFREKLETIPFYQKIEREGTLLWPIGKDK